MSFAAKRFSRRLAACVAMLCGVVCTAATHGARTPALDVDFADPFVLPVNGGLVAYATNTRRGDRWMHVPMSRSRDGATWSMPVEAMPMAPAWARAEQPDVWAPEVLRVGDRYVLYFSARHATRRRPDGLTLCVGTAIADAPEGPFVPNARPLTCGGEHGVIDASPFRDGEDLWLYVKTDGNCCGAATTVLVQRLTADGTRLTGHPRPLKGIVNDRPWEGRVVEAPQMRRAAGAYWLFYAGNDYGGGDYATGYARCDGPTGPCRDAAENPLLRSDAGTPALVGPGHPSVFAHAGKTFIAFHGWRAPAGRDRYRAMYIDRLLWRNGKPVVAPRGTR